jgi:hypothetical protein
MLFPRPITFILNRRVNDIFVRFACRRGRVAHVSAQDDSLAIRRGRANYDDSVDFIPLLCSNHRISCGAKCGEPGGGGPSVARPARPVEWIATAAFLTRRSRCFCCFYRKLSAGDMAFAAEILEFWQPGEQGTARPPAVNPCKFATGDLAGAEIACDEPRFAAPFGIAILLIIERISQFVKD